MWERRYGFPKPDRNPAGVRVYTQEHVERLMLVARTLKAGYRAGEVVSRSRDELSDLLPSTANTGLKTGVLPSSVESLLRHLERDDVPALVVEIRQNLATLGPKRFVVEVCSPLVERVGEAWAVRELEIRHEHMLSAVLATQLRLMLSTYEGATAQPVVLLATLPGEHHALGMEMAALYLALSGATPRLLGVDSPPDQIVSAARHARARVIGISISASAKLDAVTEDLEWLLRETDDDTRVWLGGRRSKSVALIHPRLDRLPTWDDLDGALARLN